MPSILIFESDQSFANEIRAELNQRGCEVSIVEDANLGLQQASASPPDLILLCTELPRMNGFSVCNRLKRDDNLQGVPIVIMSANASEETFQQHRNLTKKRADDYVHKPIAARELVERVSPLIGLQANGHARAEASEEAEELEPDELLVEELPPDAPASAPPRPSSMPVAEDDVSEFAEQAFGAIMAPEPAAPAAAPATNGASVHPASVPPPSGNGSLPPTTDPTGLSSSVPPPNRSDLRTHSQGLIIEQLQAELAAAKERAEELQEEVSRAQEKDQRIEQLHAELDDAKARLASGGGGKAREILDLREALNKKDKELLDLRDQLTRKDKELLEVRDTTLVLERKTAEAEEHSVEMEKKLAASERAEQAAKQDREQAAKRADSFKRKADKLSEDLQALRTTIDQAHAEVDAARERESELQGHVEALTASLQESQQQASALQQSLAAAASQRDQAHARSAELERQLKDVTGERDALNTHLATRNDQLQQAATQRDALRRELEQQHQRFEELTQRQQELQQVREEQNRRLSQLEGQLDDSQIRVAELGELVDKHRLAAGELSGLLGDALTKLRDIQA